jgi:regulator of protease activity HflC (stomatin/prohibitin superfamily)
MTTLSRQVRLASRSLCAVLGIALTSGACMTIVRPGEIGVRDTLGAQSDVPSPPGFKVFLWPIWDITTISTQLTNLRVEMNLPSKEGLTIASEISILYRIDPARAPLILRDIGGDYEDRFLLPVFRSAVADVCARFAAKDMHSGKRAEIEDEVRKTMNLRINGRGFEIAVVLLKSIKLPAGLSTSIEARMRAEQEAQQMEYVVQREKQEAERRLIEAQGIRDANLKLSEGLTPAVLRYKAIDALKALASSPNAKLVITPNADPLALGGLQALDGNNPPSMPLAPTPAPPAAPPSPAPPARK